MGLLQTRHFQNHHLQALEHPSVFSHSWVSATLSLSLSCWSRGFPYGPHHFTVQSKGWQRCLQWHLHFSLSSLRNWRGKIIGRKQKMLCPGKLQSLHPQPLPHMFLLPEHSLMLLMQQQAPNPSSKSKKESALFQNYSVLFCGHGGIFHSWAYSPHCCIQSKPLKSSYGPSSTKNT